MYLFRPVPLDEITRRLGQEDETDDDDQTPCELNGDGDTIAAGIITLSGPVVDDCREEETLVVNSK
jgi:hypothetical protein